ncbi:MAG: amidohydrolase, partial [Thermoplasmata archaeon]|nr:amidohydrolase [Thermoplasmata archaeon]
THTHAAMTLLRGYADDMPLFEWLQNKIWPVEAGLKPEDIYWGTKLAILEMIKSGTTAFNDMYFMVEETAKAVEEMGVRAVLSYGFIDLFDNGKREKEIKATRETLRGILGMKNPRIQAALGPHAVYTVSREGLEWIKEFSIEKDLLVHIHLSETRKENTDCVERYGIRPTELLSKVGLISDKLIAAHGVWLNAREIKLLASHRANVSHNPVSNAKLAVGRAMPYHIMRKAGMNVTLGTDGAASNNNLDMLEELKFAAIIQKLFQDRQTLMPAKEALDIATENGARALRIDSGEIAEGKLADLILIDTRLPEFTPTHNPVANLVYSASGGAVDTTICDGKVLMLHRDVEGEEEIIEKAGERAKALVRRAEG